MPKRTATVRRTTAETEIQLSLNLDGTGKAAVTTGVGFFDHMVQLLARHSLFDVTIKATGDLTVDAHHTVEDVGICFGQALDQALKDKTGIQRFGHFAAPMDEALALVAVDLSGRPCLVHKVTYQADKIGQFDVELLREFLQALANHAKMNLHVVVPYGDNNHHVAEAIFKALAKALRQAVQHDPREQSVPSTKGSL
jgi:imidazoleglycerol-phosphate dehydratase